MRLIQSAFSTAAFGFYATLSSAAVMQNLLFFHFWYSNELNYSRCFVPGCDEAGKPLYDQHWVHSAVPGTTDPSGQFKPDQCDRFANYGTGCDINLFNRNESFRCDQWVFDDFERTIVQEVCAMCNVFTYN